MPNVKVKNRYLFLLIFALLISGTLFYMAVEKWKFIDSIFFCVVTLATVGYGNMVPQTYLGKVFTMFYIVIGISVFLFFVNNLALNYGQRLKERQQERRGEKKKKK